MSLLTSQFYAERAATVALPPPPLLLLLLLRQQCPLRRTRSRNTRREPIVFICHIDSVRLFNGT
jgi:hypothetical protein